MKKNLLFLLMSFLCMNATAGQLSEAQALDIARKYVVLPVGGSSSMKLQRQKVKPSSLADEYYVFNVGENNGFVIVSGDDSLTELVGYSDTGMVDAEALPDALAAFLEAYKSYVNEVRIGNAKPYKLALGKNRAAGKVEPLLTTKWDQTDPYNKLCPTYLGKRCPSGCVATAMAQIMNYWEWPVSGVGSNSYTCKTGALDIFGTTLSRDFSQSVYDYANMRDEYVSSNWSTAEANAVAALMYDCGVAVNMQYNTTESGASNIDMEDAFVNHFRYNCTSVYRSKTPTLAFRSLVFSELDNNRPVVYIGQGTAGGHAFVVDGYDTDGFVHVNWGWSGVSDGYYNMDYMNPEVLGTGGGEGGFAWDQAAFLLQPNETGANRPIVLSYVDTETRKGGIYPASGTSVSMSQRLQINMYHVQNQMEGTFNGRIGTAIYDESGNMVASPDDGGDSFTASLLTQYWYETSVLYSPRFSSLQDGTYYIYGVCKDTGAGAVEWSKIQGTSYIEISVASNWVSVVPEKQGLLSAVEGPSVVLPEQTAGFSVEVRNIGRNALDGTLEVSILRKSTSQEVAKVYSQHVIVYDNSVFDVKFNQTIATGTYNVGETYVIKPKFWNADGSAVSVVPSSSMDFEFAVRSEIVADDGKLELVGSIYPSAQTFEMESVAHLFTTVRSNCLEQISGYLEYEVSTGGRTVATGKSGEFSVGAASEKEVPLDVYLDSSVYEENRYYVITISGFVSTCGQEVLLETNNAMATFMISGYSGVDTSGTTGVHVYPNPTTAMVNVAGTVNIMSIDVYSVAGSFVKTEMGRQVDLSSCPAGIYILSVNTGDGSFRCRVVKK